MRDLSDMIFRLLLVVVSGVETLVDKGGQRGAQRGRSDERKDVCDLFLAILSFSYVLVGISTDCRMTFGTKKIEPWPADSRVLFGGPCFSACPSSVVARRRLRKGRRHLCNIQAAMPATEQFLGLELRIGDSTFFRAASSRS